MTEVTEIFKNQKNNIGYKSKDRDTTDRELRVYRTQGID